MSDETLPPPPATPTSESVTPLALTNERVAVHDAWSRTIRRGLATLGTVGLTAYFESRGHVVPWHVVAALTALGLGIDGAANALRRRPAAAVGGAAALVGLAVAGDLSGVRDLSHLAVLGVGGLPMVDAVVSRVRA